MAHGPQWVQGDPMGSNLGILGFPLRIPRVPPPGIPGSPLGSLRGTLGSQGGTLGIPRGNPRIPRLDPIGTPWTHWGPWAMGPWTHGPLDPWAHGPRAAVKKVIAPLGSHGAQGKYGYMNNVGPKAPMGARVSHGASLPWGKCPHHHHHHHRHHHDYHHYHNVS